MKRVIAKAKYCNNEFCLENSEENIIGYLKCKNKDIPICRARNLCPDARYHYFDYKPKYIKKEDKE